MGGRYKKDKGMSREKINKLAKAEIIWYIQYLAKDKRTHIFKDDCIDFLEFKMKEIRKLVSHLTIKKPKGIK